jgi:uncharacterized protein
MEPRQGAGRGLPPEERLSPTRIAQAAACLHFYFLEKFGDKSKRLSPTAGQKLDWERGREFEVSVVRSLEGVREPTWDGRDFQQGLKATVALMEKGALWIHSGVLAGSGVAGIPDLLRKDSGKSRFGDFTYTPIEIKGHKTVQKKDVLQVSAYARILDEILGEPCRNAGVWLNTGKIAAVDVAKGRASLQSVLRQIEAVRREQGGTEPIWCSACPACPWIAHCKHEWKRLGHLSLLPNGGKGTVEKMSAIGIRTVAALAKSDPEDVARKAKMAPPTALSLWHHARARIEGRPLPIRKAKFPEGLPIIFYDIETFGGETFLHGLIRVDGDNREERFFFADSLADAGAAWRQFLEFVARDAESVIYCWADYERGCAEKSWAQFGGDKKAYASFMRRLTDQCAWTKKHFAFPTRGYSIKEVAPALGFHWKAADAGGLNCEAWYGEWLRSGEAELKRKILEYNRDDVLAMEVIFNHLKQITGEPDGKSR